MSRIGNWLEMLFRRPAATDTSPEAIISANERTTRFARAWAAYYGHYARPLKVVPGRPDDNVAVNFARIVVDKGVSFLFGRDVGFEINLTERTAAEEWLAACWRHNRKMTLLQNLALNGAVCGHAFVKIVPSQPYPRLIVLDPGTVTVRWEADDIERIVSYTIRYTSVDPQTDEPVEVRQIVERDGQVWRIVDQIGKRNSRDLVTVGENTWPYPWPPIVDCQNLPAPNEFWGLSDLTEDILRLNDAINFVLSNLIRIVRYHAHPKTWGRGFTASQLNIAADETIILPSADAELRNLEMTSDLAGSIALYERLREALHEVTRVPEVATGKLDRAGALSGVALQILYQPLLEKTETKRRLYGDLLIELNRRLLALAGFGDEINVILLWPQLLPADQKAEAETALLQQQIGVSQDTLLQRMGFDPDLERQKREVSGRTFGEQLLTAFERGE